MGKNVRILINVLFCIYMAGLVIVVMFKGNLVRGIQDMFSAWSVPAVMAHFDTANVTPFDMIYRYIISRNSIPTIVYTNIIGNIAIFVPFGILYPLRRLSKGRPFAAMTVLMGALVPLAFEVIQLFTLLGEFDVDDLILNFSGVMTGLLIFGIIYGIYNVCGKGRCRKAA